jgi:hypothetical protein
VTSPTSTGSDKKESTFSSHNAYEMARWLGYRATALLAEGGAAKGVSAEVFLMSQKPLFLRGPFRVQ